MDEFRARYRDWLVAHVPAGWRERETVELARWWMRERDNGGWSAPAWPIEHGGMGATLAQQLVMYEEEASADAPGTSLFGIALNHAGATLIVHGSDEQRQHLPRIRRGEEIWCQGFSEPDAGSDLASLSTRAVRDGDHYVVSGQKVWSSFAEHADWCLLLARTDPDAPKRKGISYFLLDMTTPGVEVRPIRNAIGDSHFCEIFLNDVSIPAANLVGAENAGWQVAQATLGAERGLTMLELAERLGNAGFRWLVQACPLDDPIVADRLAQFETEITGLRGLCRKVVEDNEAGTAGPADASIVKLYYSELLQRLTDFGMEIGGLTAHTELAKPMSSGWESGSWVLDFIGSWEWTIPGGSSEIQRTIIAERGLGLPREPSVV